MIIRYHPLLPSHWRTDGERKRLKHCIHRRWAGIGIEREGSLGHSEWRVCTVKYDYIWAGAASAVHESLAQVREIAVVGWKRSSWARDGGDPRSVRNAKILRLAIWYLCACLRARAWRKSPNVHHSRLVTPPFLTYIPATPNLAPKWPVS